MSRLKRFASIPLAFLEAVSVPLMTAYLRLRHGANGWMFVLFPRLPDNDRKRLGDNGVILPDPGAPVCPGSELSTDGWIEQTPSIPADGVDHLTLRLPGRYMAQSIQYDPKEGSPVESHILGMWNVSHSQPNGPPEQDRQLGLWINAHNGFPTVGSPPKARQVTFSECQVKVGDQTMFLVQFTLEIPAEGETHYVGAVWPAGPAGWITALGSGRTQEAQAEIRAALESVRFSLSAG